MRPKQLGELAIPSDPRLHPDGNRIAFVVTRLDLEDDRYVKRIWLWDGDRSRPLTAGPTDTAPRWSPDGTRLAFLRKGEGDDAWPQLALLDMAGGEADTLTDFPLGVSEAEWSPHGDQIALVAAEWIPRLAGLDSDERKRRPRRVTEFPFRFDNMGWVADYRRHLHLFDVQSARSRQVTDGDFNEHSVSWHPAGATLAFVSARHDSRGLDAGEQVWTVSTGGGDPQAATEIGLWDLPTFNPAGRLHVIGSPDRWNHPAVQPLCAVGDGKALDNLTGHLDRNVLPLTPTVSPAGPQWLTDGGAVITIEDQGKIKLARMAADGVTRDLIDGPRAVTGASPNGDASRIAFTATSPCNPGELYILEDGRERQLSHLNAGFAAGSGLVDAESFVISHDGVEVEGWIYLPPGDDVVPVLLLVHGGPAAAYGYWFLDEFQVLAGAGYGVVAINPRGSQGYGSDHVSAIVGTWHEEDSPDMVDLLAAVDAAAAEQPRLNKDLMGVMGGSYGGYAAARMISRDQRYKSAVVERSLLTFASFIGTSDIGPWFSRMYLGEQGLVDLETLWRSGPLAAADQIDTPTLIVHSEGDYRTPIEQGEQLFARLLLNGVHTEMVRFPAPEGHELSRSGTPKHRVERFEIILDWHDRFLRQSAGE